MPEKHLSPTEVKLTCTTALSVVITPLGIIMESGHVRAAKLSSRGVSKDTMTISALQLTNAPLIRTAEKAARPVGSESVTKWE